jgi:hypothetical protein
VPKSSFAPSVKSSMAIYKHLFINIRGHHFFDALVL